jgi:hypothetical protein
MRQAMPPRTDPTTLNLHECIYHRDQLRAARYAALADAEGFQAVCYALEALGLCLLGKKASLGSYEQKLRELARWSVVLTEMSLSWAGLFGKFDPLFELVRTARNDAMHTGVYARHATAAAIELCIGLEEALMKQQNVARSLVEDYMVRSPITVEKWQPIAHARQLMLMHSFSFLPVYLDSWKLLSEGALARYLRKGGAWNSALLSVSIERADGDGLELVEAPMVGLNQDVQSLLGDPATSPRIWLVKDERDKLCGVLSPFELM